MSILTDMYGIRLVIGEFPLSLCPDQIILEQRSLDLTTCIPDHRGQQPFVETAHRMEEYLARQPAHIAAQKARGFKQSVATLYRQWDQTEPEFRTTILPIPPVSFRTQFRTSNGRIS